MVDLLVTKIHDLAATVKSISKADHPCRLLLADPPPVALHVIGLI